MTVFVVQKQMRFDEASGNLVPRFTTIDKAERWGKLAYLLSPSAHPFNPEGVLQDMHAKLKSYGDGDYLVLIGNPALIGMATTIAAHYNEGKVNLLQWSGRASDYTEIRVRIF